MIQFFANLSVGAKIIWLILVCVFAFSIYGAITTKGEEGGIAAGVVSGLVIHSFVILENKSLMRFADRFRYAEWYVVVGVIIGFFVCLGLFFGLLSVTYASKRNRGAGSFFLVILRIISVAGATVILLFAFRLIRSGGIIFY